MPLLLHQMKRNGYKEEEKAIEKTDHVDLREYKYVCTLFEYFCDSKRDYIDLSCINEEIKKMDKSLQQILFEDIKVDEHTKAVHEYKINDKNIKYVFPHLVEYKNHMSYWIYVGDKE